MSDFQQTHFVYRISDVAGRLLYIGCTRDVWGRIAVHRSSWNNPASAVISLRADWDSVEIEEYPSKEAARAAERKAIHDEAPIANLHHQRERVSPAERIAALDAYLESTRPPIDPELVSALDTAPPQGRRARMWALPGSAGRDAAGAPQGPHRAPQGQGHL